VSSDSLGHNRTSTPLQKKSELEQEKIEQIIEKIVKFRTLNLSNNSLSHIPEALIKSIEGVTATFKKKKKKIVVKDISFTNNKFVKWPVDFLTKMSALNILEVTELNAQFCALQDIECDWAKLFPTIERVYLFANYIRSIPDSLGKCENLVTIDIRSNPCIRPKDEFLPFLTDYNLCRIKNLTTLKISSCYDFIKNDKDDSGDEDKLYVPLSLLEIHQESLTTLDLSFNNIISFCGRPKKPICMKSLTELSLILNEISTLESTVFNGEVLPVLKTLRLSNNKLTELPDEFCSINSLEKLFIDHNNLASLPKNFGNLKKLIHLDLGSNCIKELPESFQNLRELFVLDLKSNQIESVSNQILENLCELSDLFLSGNKLSNETFSLKIMGKHMKNLNILNLGFNNFTSIHEIFEFEDEEKGELCLPNIKQLILTGNKLTSFPDQLTKRSSLSILHLAHNRLKTLPENFFQNLKNIQKLSLCGNQLDNRVLPSDSLLTEKATILDLSHNNFDFSKVDLGKLNPLFLEGRKHFSRDFQIDFNNNEEESLTEANEFILSGVAHTIGRRPNMEDTYIINKNIDTGSSDLRFQLWHI
jgi:Leucine-rich repeat (LRR) protein